MEQSCLRVKRLKNSIVQEAARSHDRSMDGGCGHACPDTDEERGTILVFFFVTDDGMYAGSHEPK